MKFKEEEDKEENEIDYLGKNLSHLRDRLIMLYAKYYNAINA